MNRGCLFSLVGFLVIATAGLAYYFISQREQTAENFDTEKPVITDIIKKTVATGAIRPRQEVFIKPQVSGVVDELYVEAGEMVKKGDPIAKIKLIPNQVNINTAQSNVELARIRLNESKRELERQKEVNNRSLDVETARVNYENARLEEERQRELYEDGVVSQQDYNRFKVDMEVAKAAYENAKIVSGNDLKRFEADLDIRQQELQAAINNLQLLREGAARNSKQIANIVTSTVDGMILDIPVEEGSSVIERNNFNEGTSIATVADMNNLIFEGNVDESDVGKLQEGMAIILTVGAIQDATFDANLEYIAPQGVDEEGTVKFEVRAAIQPTEEVFLRAGYSANGDIILDQRKQVIAINERDLLFEDDKTFVEVKTGDRQFEKKAISLGLSDGIMTEVVNGIDTTAQVRVRKPSS
ncbi:MAG: HlyD family efflux transporter periplasmic adaptor subunit [Bacteroidota bacterium]